MIFILILHSLFNREMIMIFHNTIEIWSLFVIAVIAIYVGLKIFRTVVIKIFTAIVKKSKSNYDDYFLSLLADIKNYFYIVLSIYIATFILNLPENGKKIISVIFLTVFFIQIAGLIVNLMNFSMDKYVRKTRGLSEEDEVRAMMNPIRFVSKIVIWSFALLLILDNSGIDVTSLIAGLGIGGIAIALAVQNVLGDLFASMSIALDKPFVAGDFIALGDKSGVVESIGIKSTRIKSLTGEEIVVSNSNLLNSTIHNYKKMKERRIVFSFGVLYETDMNSLKEIPKIVKNIIEKQEFARFDRAHFKNFGDFSLDFEVVYYMTTNDYGKYMDTQQAVNLELLDEFKNKNIEFAYPTQLMYSKNI